MEKVTEQQDEEHFEYPIPENCYETWKRWKPEEHYQRLFDAADEEARLHLLNLILCRLKSDFYESSILKTGVSRGDLAHQIWVKTIGKIRDGSLVMRVPGKFYSMLKKIIASGITDNYRRFGWRYIEHLGDMCQWQSSGHVDGDAVDEDQLLVMGNCQNIEMDLHNRYILQQVQLALVKEAPMGDLERKALILSILVKTGQTELSDNGDIARALSNDTGNNISYQMVGTLIHNGMIAFKAYFDKKKIDWRSFANPSKAEKK